MIEGGKISASVPSRRPTPSAGDRLIDLPNATVLPGLTDAHTHLTGDPQDVGHRGPGDFDSARKL